MIMESSQIWNTDQLTMVTSALWKIQSNLKVVDYKLVHNNYRDDQLTSLKIINSLVFWLFSIYLERLTWVIFKFYWRKIYVDILSNWSSKYFLVVYFIFHVKFIRKAISRSLKRKKRKGYSENNMKKMKVVNDGKAGNK